MENFLDDWASYEVKLCPLSRQLSEQMNRREWMEAADTAQRLANVVSYIHANALAQEMASWQRRPKQK